MQLTTEFQSIRDWAANKGIYEKGDPLTQYAKLMEEVGELAKSLLEQNEEELRRRSMIYQYDEKMRIAKYYNLPFDKVNLPYKKFAKLRDKYNKDISRPS